MPHLSLSPAKYAQQLTAHQEKTMPAEIITPPIDENDWAAIPEADSPEDVDAPHESSTRVALDGGHADVDVFSDRVEVTIRLGGRSVLGIALSHMEAANLGRAISSPAGATTGDLFHVADTLGVNAGDIMRLQNRAVNA